MGGKELYRDTFQGFIQGFLPGEGDDSFPLIFPLLARKYKPAPGNDTVKAAFASVYNRDCTYAYGI